MLKWRKTQIKLWITKMLGSFTFVKHCTCWHQTVESCIQPAFQKDRSDRFWFEPLDFLTKRSEKDSRFLGDNRLCLPWDEAALCGRAERIYRSLLQRQLWFKPFLKTNMCWPPNTWASNTLLFLKRLSFAFGVQHLPRFCFLCTKV